MRIVAQSGAFYLLCADPEAASKDSRARGELFHARTGERHPAFIHNTLKQGYWGPWDGKPVPGLPESRPAAASA